MFISSLDCSHDSTLHFPRYGLAPATVTLTLHLWLCPAQHCISTAQLSPFERPVPFTIASWVQDQTSLRLLPPHSLRGMTKGPGPSDLFTVITTVGQTLGLLPNLLGLPNTHQIAKQFLIFVFEL